MITPTITLAIPAITLAIKIRDAVMDQLARDGCGNAENLHEAIYGKLAYAEAMATPHWAMTTTDCEILMQAVAVVNMAKNIMAGLDDGQKIVEATDVLRTLLRKRGFVVS